MPFCKALNIISAIWPLRALIISDSQRNSSISKSKRASPAFSFRASMTVEASLVLPLYLFFMANILYSFEMIRIESEMTAALHEAGTAMSEYAYYAAEGLGPASGDSESDESTGSGFALSALVSETYVRSSVKKFLGGGFMEHTGLLGDSLSYLQSDIMEEGGVIDLAADYRIRPFIPLMGPGTISAQSRYCGHAWTGWDIETGQEEEEDPDDPIVYVTKNGSVYHRDRNCTYLYHPQQTVNMTDIPELRNTNGGKYYPCEKCKPAGTESVVITSDGNRYHRSDCSLINPDVRGVKLSEVKDTMGPCHKCGGE